MLSKHNIARRLPFTHYPSHHQMVYPSPIHFNFQLPVPTAPVHSSEWIRPALPVGGSSITSPCSQTRTPLPVTVLACSRLSRHESVRRRRFALRDADERPLLQTPIIPGNRPDNNIKLMLIVFVIYRRWRASAAATQRAGGQLASEPSRFGLAD